MEIEFHVSAAVFLLVSNAIFVAASLSVEASFHHLETVWRIHSVKTGKVWNGFFNVGLFRRILELRGWRKSKISAFWIVLTLLFSVVLSAASFAGEIGVSTRVKDKVEGTIVAYSQKGAAVKNDTAYCSSPIECEEIGEALKDLVNSGDFSILDLKSSELGGTKVFGRTDAQVPVKQLPTDDLGTLTFMSCLQIFRDHQSTVEANLYTTSCGDIEQKHEVVVRLLAAPDLIRKDDPNAASDSDPDQGFFKRAVKSKQATRGISRFRSITADSAMSMDLSYYVDRNLSLPCEIAIAAKTEDSLDFFAFTCPLEDGKTAVVGCITDWLLFVYVDAMTVTIVTPGVSIRWEDVFDAIYEQAPSIVNVGLSGARGKIQVLRTFVYATMMSTNRSVVNTVKQRVVIVVSVWWAVSSAVLLFVPILAFGFATGVHSLFMPRAIRRRKISLPVTTSDVYFSLARSITALKGDNFDTDSVQRYDLGLYEPVRGASRLHLGWTVELCPLDRRQIYVE